MTTHERFERMYRHVEADRVPVMDYAWPETIQRWRREGLPTDDYVSYFDLDKTASIATDNSPRLPVYTVEETEDYIIRTTPWGVANKNFKSHTTTPEDVSHVVNSYEAWKKVRERMTPADDRIPWDMLRREYKTWRSEGRWITGELWFGFDITHSHMVGTETVLMAMFDEPEWIIDMIDRELTLSLQLLERVWDAGYTFDEIHWPDDMGYKGTQFFSLSMYREIVKPFHQRAIDWGHAHGCKVRLHSCGNIMPFVPELVEMGLDGLNPLEVKAGMDPLYLKKTYGDKLLFHGGINAANWGKRAVITKEIETYVPMLKEKGGYIFASDHSIPDYVSFEDFKNIIETVKRVGSYE